MEHKTCNVNSYVSNVIVSFFMLP